MALRAAAHLPRLVVLGAVLLFAGAGLTYGAAQRLSADASSKQPAAANAPTVTVPDVVGQAFVFAKGELEDAGFAWQVVGSVHGYAVNRVVTQKPAAGTKLRDTGAPTITVRLVRTSYPETGEPEDVAPYYGTAVVPAVTVAAPAPASAATVPSLTPARTTPKTTVPKQTPAPKQQAAKPKPRKQNVAKRPPAFTVPGAPKEPLKEMPLTKRALLLTRWLSAHPHPTNAGVRHFLYQHAWIVTGARFGWWHGADALRLLIAADQKAIRLWGIGYKSELAARHALAEVKARSR